MKKLFFTTIVMLGIAGFVNAQKTTNAKTVKPVTTTPAVKPVTATTPVVKPVATSKTPLKADGTPDKRFKENKTTTPKTTGPLKADGTPDKRYNANKPVKKG